MQATAVGAANAEAGTALVNSIYSQNSTGEGIDPQGPSISVYGRCLRGFMVGLCLEGVLALGLYAMYHLGRFLH